MRNGVLAAMALMAALPLGAQQATAPARPVLVNDTNLHAVESPLVRAAKRTLAARRTGTQGGWVVDDQFILRTTGHISQSRGATNSSRSPYSSESNTAPGSVAMGSSAPSGPDAAVQAQKAAAVRQQHAMAVEALQDPYGGDVDQDQTVKTLVGTPGEATAAPVPMFVPPVPIQPPQ